MAYVHAARLYPAAGKIGEMQPVMEEFAKAVQSAGSDARLSVCRYGPEYPYFLLASRYDTLADREKLLPTLLPITRKYNTQLGPISRQPSTTILMELLENANPSAPKWVFSNEMAPKVGCGPALRALLVDAVKQLGAQGGRSNGLLVQVAGPEAGAFVRNFNFSTLAEVEEWRAGIDRTSDFVRQRDELISRPIQSSIREVIVPFMT